MYRDVQALNRIVNVLANHGGAQFLHLKDVPTPWVIEATQAIAFFTVQCYSHGRWMFRSNQFAQLCNLSRRSK